MIRNLRFFRDPPSNTYVANADTNEIAQMLLFSPFDHTHTLTETLHPTRSGAYRPEPWGYVFHSVAGSEHE